MKFRRGCRGAYAALIVIVLDRLTKAWAMNALYPGEVRYSSVLNFRNVGNTGAAFGIFGDSGAFLTIAIFILLGAVLAYVFISKKLKTLARIGLWMVIGGGASNLFDRICYGHVIDFIEPAFVRFAVFNVADVFICIGAVLAGISLIKN